jgi:altronate hydrolase
MKKYIRINRRDTVGVALENLNALEEVILDNMEVTLLENINKGHKFALEDISAGSNVYKYGMAIGYATQDIKKGEWVHTQNVKTNLSDVLTYTYKPNFVEQNVSHPERKINVYPRKNGNIGIRNELWIIPTVGCVNGMAKLMMEEFKRNIGDKLEIDGTNVMVHNYGCSQLGEDHINTRTILQNLVKHPNAGGVLVLGLGCENNQMADFIATLGEYDSERTRFMIAQEVEDEIEEGVKLLEELYSVMKNDKREERGISELVVGLECGGSDGFSGITANPMLGEFSDYLIAKGGTSILTEVPEMFGAETLLMERCEDQEIYEKTVDMVNDFKEYFIKHEQNIYENPSPGNKKGGITTLEDKSLGCTQKSGTSKVKDVLKYGEIVKKKGLNLLSAPGNDLVATTALGAAGCHMVLFTTGRGNPYGGFIPTMKISTNTDLANKKPRWIDFNAGRLVSEDISMDCLLEDFIDYIARVASGELINNEKNNFREMAIFKSGVTL